MNFNYSGEFAPQQLALDELSLKHTAYHEAAHAVVGYYFGWKISRDGVTLDGDGYCGLSAPISHRTERATACVFLAGWLAETLLSPDRAKPHSDEDVFESLCNARCGDADTDDEQVFAHLLQERPYADEESLLKLYRGFETETLAILRKPAVWAAVERVATALLDEGRLTDDEVAPLCDMVRGRALWPKEFV